MKLQHPTIYSRYLPVEPDAIAWGAHVVDCGFGEIPAGSLYPAGAHPTGYLFTWERGRVLSEYQMVYITRGKGVFESKSSGRIHISEGQVFILFPGEWHRYRPLKNTGWDENWIGFDGEYARHVMSRFFTPAEPALRVGYDEELLRLIRSTAELMQTVPTGYQQMMASHVIEALARIRALAMRTRTARGSHEKTIQQARILFMEQADREIKLDKMARSLGMSYTRFRAAFRIHTGFSPRQYHLQIRMNKAKALLNESDLTIGEISERLGFSSIYYFSRLFRRKIGHSPNAWRRRHINHKQET